MSGECTKKARPLELGLEAIPVLDEWDDGGDGESAMFARAL